MKQVTLNVPDSKMSFFLELIKNLGISKIEDSVPEEHKKIVLERIKKSNDLLDWDQVKLDFKFD